MTATTFGSFRTRPSSDRNAFLSFVALVWVGVISGFGTDSYSHVSAHGLDYPLIVHFHALAMVSWLVLFTVQVSLIRAGRPELHRRLGLFGMGLAAVMVVLGPATAITVDGLAYVQSGHTPEFLAVQFTDMIAFATIIGAGLLLRRNAAAHKRLMLMGLFYISDAGFARFLNHLVPGSNGTGFWPDMTGLYFGSDLLMLALGAYDLVTRRRLHPAYLAAFAWALVLELTAQYGLHSAAWRALSLHIIGH